MPDSSRASADRSSFLLETNDPTYRGPAFLGNGAFSLVSTALGTSASQSFAAGLYDRADGDVPRIALLPAWNVLDVSAGDGWLNEATADALESYRQTLDMYDGTLRTTYDWVRGAARISVEVTAFVSRAAPEIAVVQLRLVPRTACRLTVRFGSRDWPARERQPLARLERVDTTDVLKLWQPGHVAVAERSAAALVGRVEGGRGAVAIAHRVASSGVTVDDDASEITFEAEAGMPVSFTKVVSVVATRDRPPLPSALDALQRAHRLGYEQLLREHTAAWHRLWESDVIVEGDDEMQRLVHAMLFSILSCVREGSDESIPPMGLSSAGYLGHIFWDADTWIFPALLLLHPELARSIVAFRSRTLGAARDNASANGQRGAMYPWEADENGAECTPLFAKQNALSEIHISGDVALAQWQYHSVTGDRDWLEGHAYPVITQTADFWVGRATGDGSGRYEIRGVVSVDEDQIGVANEAYTNAVARKNLELAIAASRLLGRAPDPAWQRVASALVMPLDAVGEFHHSYDGAPAETRGAVATLLAYPLAAPMTERTKRNDLANAVRRLDVSGGGAMMTLTLYPVIAAELGDADLLDALVPRSYASYLRGPFHALAETPRNDAVNFLTGAGGFLQQVMFGYTGLRIGDEGLVVAHRPLLPKRLSRVVLRGVWVRGSRVDVVADRGSTRFVPV